MVETTPGVTAIVAAYDEAPRIAGVLEVLCSYPGFSEVVVVDDGSTDDTAAVARGFPVTVLEVRPNQGKGHAMDVGVRHASTDLIFFADADIVGLTHQMIEATVDPVRRGECEMFVLMRNRKIYLLHKLMVFIPLLGGERALTRDLWLELPDRFKDRFKIETGLNFYAIHHGGGLRYGVFRGITQTIKEAKFGWLEGFRRRMAMFGEVISAAWDLQRHEVPPTTRARRAEAGFVGLSALGMVLGTLIVAAGLAGPLGFVSRLFSEELMEDPDAWLPRTLVRLVSGIGTSALVAIGTVVLALNAAFLMVSLVRLATAGRVRRGPGT